MKQNEQPSITIELVGGPAGGTQRTVKTLLPTITIPDPAPAAPSRKAIYSLGPHYSPGGVRQYVYRGSVSESQYPHDREFRTR